MPNIITVRHDPQRPYVMIARAAIHGLGADLQALGLLVVLIGKPPDWRVRPDALARELGASRPTLYRVLARLIEAGYVKRFDVTRRLPDGRFERRTHYTVFETREAAALYTAKDARADELEHDRRPVTLNGEVVPF